MAKVQLYRVINLIEEKIGEEVDAVSRPLSPRIYKTLELSTVFNLITKFWEATGCQLLTAVKALSEPEAYFPKLQETIAAGETLFPASNINDKDSIMFGTMEMVAYWRKYQSLQIYLSPFDVLHIWEYLWELVRQAKYPNCISRYNCLFAFGNKGDAEKYLKERIRENQSYKINKICRVDIKHLENQEVYDMRWLDKIEIYAKYNEYIRVADNYWSCKMTNLPLKEVLFQGVYELCEIK